VLPSKSIAAVLFLAMLTATGCFHRPSPFMPDDWPVYAADDDLLAADPEAPRLQIVIGYFDLWPNHAALRLVAPGRPVVFWDPGGGYGVAKPPFHPRTRDIIVDGAPDLATYLPFRWYNNDALTEIFEWYLSAAEARRMHHILMAGAGIAPDPAIDFDTETPGFFCAAAISKFLQRFGAPTIRIEQPTISPGRLSRDLYRKQPDRVLLSYRRERPQILVMSNPNASRNSHRMAREGAVTGALVAD
jgi:hypothetical protein